MVHNTKNMSFPPNLNTENLKSDDTSNTSVRFDEPEPIDYYKFFKLFKINVLEMISVGWKKIDIILKKSTLQYRLV